MKVVPRKRRRTSEIGLDRERLHQSICHVQTARGVGTRRVASRKQGTERSRSRRCIGSARSKRIAVTRDHLLTLRYANGGALEEPSHE